MLIIPIELYSDEGLIQSIVWVVIVNISQLFLCVYSTMGHKKL